ncbi:hypothetical protein CI610_00381 [invertebrate metagenome]|uniref:Uncharacterized protein n=1 Tax=invertebrate metagenome TaxID=1711999 RepID=A0A2H9TBM2_9ZZZZ
MFHLTPRWLIALPALYCSFLTAANNPIAATSGSSTGDFDIEMIMPPLAQIGFPNSLTNVDFGDFDETFGFKEQQQGFCVFHNTQSVTLVAESSRSTAGGRFVLAHSSTEDTVSPDNALGIEYEVEVFGRGVSVNNGFLTASIPTPDFTAANAKITDVTICSQGTANMELRVSLVNGIDFTTKNTGAYRDELTLTVNAE